MPINKKCQVFTPSEYATKMLDIAGYEKDIVGKKVLENSCGDGNILLNIVERYFKECFKKKMTHMSIINAVESDITAYEIDSKHIKICIDRLNQLAEQYNLYNINWNIIEKDFLKENILGTYDFIIGNPPYITYRDLSLENREFVKENYETCNKGKFDYCYAFVEASIKALKKNGKLVYLIPGNVFKNVFGAELRKFILPYLSHIYDYTNQKIFSGKLTSSSIIVCTNGRKTKKLSYNNITEHNTIKIDKILLQSKWIFKNDTVNDRDVLRFGDVYHAATSIATLLNKVFILHEFKEDDSYVYIKEHKIEKSLLKKAVSPRSLNYKISEYLVFPYIYSDTGIERYSLDEFKKIFPCGFKYLLSHKKKLDERNSDANAKWFEFGRSQALSHLNQGKLLMSTLMTHETKVYQLDAETIPTSGIYIVSKGEYTLDIAMRILQSQEFIQYVKEIGVISNGNSYRISPKDVNNFKFSTNLLLEE